MKRPIHRLSWILLTAAVACAVRVASAQVVLPGLETSELEPALKGRVLIEELSCASCHKADAVAASSRQAPRLSAVGGRVNPDYLQAFIESPQRIKPGTLMPDLLGALGAGERREVAASITHFLLSLDRDAVFELEAPDAVAAAQGERLFHAVGCVACHSPRDPDGKELLPETSVPLGDLEKKYSHRSLGEFLRRPHASRPSGRMPELRLPGHEIERITHYLLQKTAVPGHLAYTTWRGKVWEGLEGDVEAEKAGQVADFSLARFGKGTVQHHTAIRYRGFLRIQDAGEFTFHVEMNGGRLLVNGTEVVGAAPSDRRGTKKLSGVAKLASGWNHLELTYFHTGHEPRLGFEMEGPGFERQAIPASMLATSDKPIPVLTALKIDPDLVEKGRSHFERLGCAQCHDDIKSPRRQYTDMARLDFGKGCLAEDPATPRFLLSPDQKRLIALALPPTEASTFTDLQRVNKTLVAFNCIACHERAGLGGVSPERNAHFTGTKEALGDQGRLPPPLSHIGAKLTRSWLTEVLFRGGRQRPYLNTRMPVFGEAQVGHLVELFEAVDTLEEVSIPKISNLRESKDAGYEMMGTNGLSCVACHDFNGQQASGAGALELVYVTERLQKRWFHLYLREPSRFHPAVIMPGYWPGGQSIRQEILNGDTDQQIEALWAYLSDGTRARSPRGLSRKSQELRVTTEAVLCRGRGPASYRGIGVGYPERISLVFDSEEMALRQLWKGEFANVDNGSFSPRGEERIEFPAGVPFHRLASLDGPWPYKGKTNYLFPQDHGYQYRGYFLDQERRPTFLYRYGEIAVEDFFKDLLDEAGKAFFRRTLTFAAPTRQESFFFRVASGKEVTAVEMGWQIDKLKVRVPGDQRCQVRDGQPRELLMQLDLPEGKTVLELEYRW